MCVGTIGIISGLHILRGYNEHILLIIYSYIFYNVFQTNVVQRIMRHLHILSNQNLDLVNLYIPEDISISSKYYLFDTIIDVSLEVMEVLQNSQKKTNNMITSR